MIVKINKVAKVARVGYFSKSMEFRESDIRFTCYNIVFALCTLTLNSLYRSATRSICLLMG